MLTRQEEQLFQNQHPESAFNKIWDNPEDADYDNL